MCRQLLSLSSSLTGVGMMAVTQVSSLLSLELPELPIPHCSPKSAIKSLRSSLSSADSAASFNFTFMKQKGSDCDQNIHNSYP